MVQSPSSLTYAHVPCALSVTAIVPLNVLSILSSNLRNNLWSESVAPQRMSSVFSVPPDLVLPHLVSLSPVALMALEVAQSLREPSVAYQDPGMETQTCPFLHNSRPLAAILGNEKPLSNPRWLSCNGILVDKQQRPRSAPNVAMCHSADLVSTFSAITPSTYQPVCGVNCFATPQSGFYHVGEFGTATPRKHRPMLGNMVLSSCPGKKVRLNCEFYEILSYHSVVLLSTSPRSSHFSPSDRSGSLALCH